jgi:hypothetical protein
VEIIGEKDGLMVSESRIMNLTHLLGLIEDFWVFFIVQIVLNKMERGYLIVSLYQIIRNV